MILTICLRYPSWSDLREWLEFRIIDQAQQYRLIHVRRTPDPRKTTLMKLIAHQLLEYSRGIPLHASTGWSMLEVNEKDWDDYLEQETGIERHTWPLTVPISDRWSSRVVRHYSMDRSFQTIDPTVASSCHVTWDCTVIANVWTTSLHRPHSRSGCG